jgi:hypothetical protein
MEQGQHMATQQDNQQKPARRRAGQGHAPPSTSQVESAASGEGSEISNEARYMMIQEAAYWRAERRGFEPGFELEDWLAAENEIDSLLEAGDRDVNSQ